MLRNVLWPGFTWGLYYLLGEHTALTTWPRLAIALVAGWVFLFVALVVSRRLGIGGE